MDIPGATNTTSSLLLLKNGTNAGDYNKSPQIQFAYNNGGTQYSHFIVSRHSGSSHHHNALDFYLCNTTPNNSISSGVNRVLTIDKQSTIINSFKTTIGFQIVILFLLLYILLITKLEMILKHM